MSIAAHSFDIAWIEGRGRDSRLPSGFPSIAGTALASMIESCTPGRVLRFTDAAIPGNVDWPTFVVQNTLHPDIPCFRDHPTWGSKCHWDRLRLCSFHLAERTPNTTPLKKHFSSYLALSHEWVHNPLDLQLPGKAHPYGQQALDDIGGYYYYDPGRTEIRRFRIDDGVWEFIPILENGARHQGQSPVFWHEKLQMLVTLDGNGQGTHLRGWNDSISGWADLGDAAHDGYHAHGRYSIIRGDALILGGNFNSRRVTIMGSDGNVTRMDDCPTQISGVPLSTGMSNRNLSECPITGNYLLWDQGERILWEYNPDIDTWAIARDWRSSSEIGEDWAGSFYGHACAPIYGTDALIWFTGHTPRIYRHIPVLGGS